MPRSFTPHVIAEKNRTRSDVPFCYLMTIHTPTPYYWTNDNQAVESQGHTFLPMGIQVGSAELNAKGNLPELLVKVPNPENILTDDLETYNGLRDIQCTLQCVFLDDPEDIAIEEYYDIQRPDDEDEGWITLRLGAESPFLMAYPTDDYSHLSCQHKVYCGTHCQYNGPLNNVPCRRTWGDCMARGNTINFLAQPGIRVAL
jgi:phage-related protein